MTLTCPSRIDRVVVHARGALVSRLVDVPSDLAEGTVDILVPGITVLAETGTFRASASTRAVLSVKSSLEVPTVGAVPGPSVERLNVVASRIARLEAHVRVLRARRERLSELALEPALAIRTHAGRGKERIAESLASAELVRRWQEDCDERLSDLGEQLRDLALERDAAALADRQARSEERMGAGHPSLKALVRLEGRGPVKELRLEYVVMAARWWPIYTLRLEGRFDRAWWMMEGLVAQLSGEDWTGVQLALSTSDLVFDARMPELPSLRLGRAQRQKKGGYRPSPPDLEKLFAGYDKGFPQVTSSGSTPPPAAVAASTTGAGVSVMIDEALAAHAAQKVKIDLKTNVGARQPVVPSSVGAAPMPPAAMAAPSPVPGMPMPPPAAAPMPRGGVSGGYGGAPQSLAEQSYDAPVAAPPPLESEIEPADGWLDFDSLRMGAPTDPGARGRLRRDGGGPAIAERRVAARTIDALQPGPKVCDPSVTRGLFDARYVADGVAAQIPSDARPHRVRIAAADAAAEVRYRTVPREAGEVYRELRVKNPFAFPLLDGPADVYLEGSLAATADLSRLDVGGVTRVGLGVEERIRVARNVRVDEETTGLLGGGTAVNHLVSMELSSSIGAKATVEVLDRMPDTDDKDVEIKLVSASPAAGRYTQAELGSPIRGGLGWIIELSPGAKAAVEYRYRISFSSKSELVGGNRRD